MGHRFRARAGGVRASRVTVAFDAAERAAVDSTAGRDGLATGPWLGRTGLAVARPELTPLPASSRQMVQELVDARRQLQRYGTLLNQAVARLHSTGQAVELAAAAAAVAGCERAVLRLQQAAVAVDVAAHPAGGGGRR